MMNRHRVTAGMLGSVLSLLLLAVATTATATSLKEIKQRAFIRVAVANEMPYGYLAGKNDAEGFGPSTAKHVLADMGIDDIRWSMVNFDQLMSAVNDGKVDMVAASQAIRPDRCKKILFSRPNTSYGEGLLVAAGNPDDLHSYNNIAENPGLKLGVVAGATQQQFAKEAGLGSDQVVALKANTDAAKALTAGRIDAYAGTQFTVAQIGEHNNKVAAAAPYPKKPFPLNPFKDPIVGGNAMRSWGAFTFAKDSGKLRDAFNAKLAAFQKTRKWRDILTRYGLDERSIAAIDKKTTAELCEQKGS